MYKKKDGYCEIIIMLLSRAKQHELRPQRERRKLSACEHNNRREQHGDRAKASILGRTCCHVLVRQEVCARFTSARQDVRPGSLRQGRK